MKVTPCALWRLDREDMDHIFHHLPHVLDNILEHFKDHCANLLRKHEDVYTDANWYILIFVKVILTKPSLVTPNCLQTYLQSTLHQGTAGKRNVAGLAADSEYDCWLEVDSSTWLLTSVLVITYSIALMGRWPVHSSCLGKQWISTLSFVEVQARLYMAAFSLMRLVPIGERW